MTNLTNTKQEIISEIMVIANYLREHNLFNVTRVEKSLHYETKENLIIFRDRMLDVIKADMRTRALKDPESVPELKEWAIERTVAMDTFLNEANKIRQGYIDDISSLLRDWLGDDLQYFISTCKIVIGIPTTNKCRPGYLKIDIYYRENVYYENGKWFFGKGRFDINQPTSGYWNPKNKEDQNAIRFFEVLYKLATDDTGRYEVLNEYMDKNYEQNFNRDIRISQLESEFNKKAANILEQFVMNMRF